MSDPIQRAKDSNGDLVLDFDSRIGARPYVRYVDGDWDIMSLSLVPTPNYGQPDDSAEHGVNTRVHTVDLKPDGIEESTLREMAKHPRNPAADPDEHAGVSVIKVENSPFAHRDEIPAKEEIVTETECSDCGETFRQYHPDPFETCPHCGAEVLQGDNNE